MNSVVAMGVQAAKDLIVEYQATAAQYTKTITECHAQIRDLEREVDKIYANIRALEREINLSSAPQRQCISIAHLRTVYEQSGKLNAIKEWKQATGLSLMDAKMSVEAMVSAGRWRPPQQATV
jgi:ribosomal protein L7/L12